MGRRGTPHELPLTTKQAGAALGIRWQRLQNMIRLGGIFPPPRMPGGLGWAWWPEDLDRARRRLAEIYRPGCAGLAGADPWVLEARRRAGRPLPGGNLPGVG